MNGVYASTEETAACLSFSGSWAGAAGVAAWAVPEISRWRRFAPPELGEGGGDDHQHRHRHDRGHGPPAADADPVPAAPVTGRRAGGWGLGGSGGVRVDDALVRPSSSKSQCQRSATASRC